MTTPKPQQASVSFTPGMKGYVRFVVRVAKASATVYVDPLIVIA
jgi:tRNA A37 threonylcarbamoyltransferase TsaD